ESVIPVTWPPSLRQGDFPSLLRGPFHRRSESVDDRRRGAPAGRIAQPREQSALGFRLGNVEVQGAQIPARAAEFGGRNLRLRRLGGGGFGGRGGRDAERREHAVARPA